MLKRIISTYINEFQIWMRQRTMPLSVEEAEEKKFFWAKMYALTSVIFLAVTTYRAYHYDFDSSNKLGEIVSVIHNEDKPIRVLKYEGFSRVSDVTYSIEEGKELKKTYGKSSVKNPENSCID